MQDLIVTAIQTELDWENKKANLNRFDTLINAVKEPGHLIVLPEMFTTGFTMNPVPYAEEMENGETLSWMLAKSAEKKAAIAGSYIVKENGNYFNRLVCTTPEGKYHHYDKKHLFTMAGEKEKYTAGQKRITIELNGWKILPLVCYDLRFPVWSRNKFVNGKPEFDLMLYVANWPDRRVSSWDALLKARAIENACYAMGVNRVGTDGSDLYYSGHSAAYTFLGETIWFSAEKAEIQQIQFKKEELETYRSKFPVLLDADPFQL